jgi:hypothetical protein
VVTLAVERSAREKPAISINYDDPAIRICDRQAISVQSDDTASPAVSAADALGTLKSDSPL